MSRFQRLLNFICFEEENSPRRERNALGTECDMFAVGSLAFFDGDGDGDGDGVQCLP